MIKVRHFLNAQHYSNLSIKFFFISHILSKKQFLTLR